MNIPYDDLTTFGVRAPVPRHLFWLFLIVCAGLAARGSRAPAQLPATVEGTPVLRLEPHGPASHIQALAFSPDGQTLYAAGWGKAVHTWHRDPASGQFRFDEAAFRIPIGPRERGLINAIALSEDGRWLAVAGRMLARGESGFFENGRAVPTASAAESMLSDIGTIHVFDTRDGSARRLRGNLGVVLSLAFETSETEEPVLVSAGYERMVAQNGAEQEMGSVRAWHLGAGDRPVRYLAGQYVSPEKTQRPGLAVERRGADPQQVHVAIAWGDGEFRIWDVASNSLSAASTAERHDDTVVQLPDNGGWMVGAAGSLQGWFARAGQPAQQALARSFQRQVVPRALAVSRGSNRGPAAVFAALDLSTNTFQLWKIGLAGGAARDVRRLNLWPAGNPLLMPALAVSRDGRQIAVAGSGVQRIQIYGSDAWDAGQVRPQSIGSVALQVSQAAFVYDGDALGLALRTREPLAGRNLSSLQQADRVFDAGARRVIAADNAGNWRLVPATPSDADFAPVLRTLEGEGHSVIAHATAVRGRLHLLAVATFYEGNSLLWLYDLQTGKKLRECNAHTLPIRSLSFSADATLLLSCGDDQELCVWGLADLAPPADSQGAPPFAIDDVDGRPTVTIAQSRGGVVGEGDVLLGVFQDGRFQPLSNPAEFYRTFWAASPGTRVRLRRLRDSQSADVDVEAIRVVDTVNPLFSLFLTREAVAAGRPDSWQWIGWSPLGPYDSSGLDVERFLGWHFNAPSGDAPSVFARAVQYRAEYRTEGLLARLLVDGNLEAEQEPPPANRPAMRLMLPNQSVSGLAEDSRVVVREPPATANLHVLDFPRTLIAAIDWTADDQADGRFSQTPDGTWVADLSGLNWTRGAHLLTATVTTTESAAQQFKERLRIDYVPPAPAVEVLDDAQQVVGQAPYELEVSIRPTAPGQTIRYRVVHAHVEGSRVIARGDVAQPARLPIEVELEAGSNTVAVAAWNVGAEPQWAEHETTRHSVTLTRTGFTIIDPTVYLPGAEQVPIPLKADEPAVLRAERVFLSAYVRSGIRVPGGLLVMRDQEGRPVQRVSLRVGASKMVGAQLLESVVAVDLPAHARALSIEVGDQTVVREIVVIPPLPEVVIGAPLDGSVVFEGEVDLAARIDPPGYTPGWKAEVVINGVALELDGPVAGDATLASRVTLRRGENSIEVRLSDETTIRSDSIHLLYRQLPEIRELHHDMVETLPLVTLRGQIESSSVIRRVEVNGLPIDALTRRVNDSLDVWEFESPEVALRQGLNDLRVRVQNQDGWSPESSVRVTFEPPPPPPPLARIIEPHGDTPMVDAQLNVVFDVSSQSPLREVRLLQNHETIFTARGAELQARDGRERFVLRRSVPASVVAGNNVFRLLAVNAGGQSQDNVRVTAPNVPVRMVIDGFSDTRSLGERPLKPTRIRGQRIEFDEAAPNGDMWLHGRVVWYQPDARLDEKDQTLRVWVNGFQQLPVWLEPPDHQSRSREFHVPIVLNREERNLVEMSLPDLERSDASQLELEIDCADPNSRRGLHLLIVGVGVPSGQKDALVDRAISSLDGTRISNSQSFFSTPAFGYGKIWGPLVGENINRGQVLNLLFDIKDEIAKRAVKNNVVLIYYQGGEIVNDANRFYLTTRRPRGADWRDPERLQREAVSSDWLDRFTRDAHGAHLMLLDVARGPATGSNTASLSPESHAAMLRYAWFQDANAPDNARLLIGLGSALRGATQPPGQRPVVLRDVDQELAGRFEERDNRWVSKTFNTSLIYEAFIPPSLADLPLTRGGVPAEDPTALPGR